MGGLSQDNRTVTAGLGDRAQRRLTVDRGYAMAHENLLMLFRYGQVRWRGGLRSDPGSLVEESEQPTANGELSTPHPLVIALVGEMELTQLPFLTQSKTICKKFW